ncbi:hypothetical protein DVDV_3566 [Desulfovibrio sp. DV]|uniref:hypothetical protein n=1 Tax=Desulfovibrio sp. DV TaxID=1844708 RepID=UPI00094B7DBD|nr:hypothetical protein [Desulfovibrio sp. DV]OLN25185.1 hypothetical protein DVDV_3566 [Desulfovibrio sp. DV]
MDAASLSLMGASLNSTLLQTQKAGQTVAVTPTVTEASAAQTGNMLSGNFVKTNFEQSKYLTSRLDSYQTDKSFGNSMNSMLTDLAAQFALTASTLHAADGNPQYLAAYLNKHKADNSVGQLVDQQVAKASQASLDATRDDLEARAEAATDGSTATDTTATGGEAAAVSADAAASAATGGETATPQTPAAPTAAAAPAAPAVAMAAATPPSIDIQV